jgi:hypothetical protein
LFNLISHNIVLVSSQDRTRTCDSIHQPYTADTPLTLHWED